MSFQILQDNLIIDELSSIKSSFLLNGQISEIQLDPRGDRIKWPEYGQRGGEKYEYFILLDIHHYLIYIYQN